MTRTSAGGAKPQNIVITGASSGIGAALALRFSRDAAVLGLTGRNKAGLEKVAERCRTSGCEARTGIIDVRDRPALAAWLEDFDRASPVDIVIANAGVQIGSSPDGKLEDSDAAYELMETNVLGVLNTIQPLIPRMLERGRGRIVMISSIAALFPLSDSSAYSASKAAVLTYGLALRGHLHDAGVRVTVVCPGYVTSPMSARSTAWKPLEVSAEGAAERICSALQKDKAVITFPWLLAFAARSGALLPDALRRAAMRPFRFSVSRDPSNP
jgi:short-subunit dehydrogenase